ncbi:MAG: helix-turn-helix domain-containing protein, partial [Candidatus Nanoarchaeia archaeon]|nr:helix-turn-helix domain-containing protein [Candidatus Nanoarchaeia archaeon]
MVMKLFNNNKNIMPLVSNIGWKILLFLDKEPSYSLKIAKSLGIHEQKVYYHINKLFKSGIITVVKEEKIKGANAKFYAPTASIYGLSLNLKENNSNSKILDFFNEFNSNGFSGKIVVGSPEPHGLLKTWAKDSYYSAMLSFFLGNYITFNTPDAITLDTDVKLKSDYSADNFIIIGGPGVNVITLEFNDHFPVKFQSDFVGEAPSANFGKGFRSKKTGKEYTSSTIGVIQKIKNPFNPKKSIIVFAGVGKLGTYSAIYSLITSSQEILNDYSKNSEFCRIVQGNDLNGDGKIDSFEV